MFLATKRHSTNPQYDIYCASSVNFNAIEQSLHYAETDERVEVNVVAFEIEILDDPKMIIDGSMIFPVLQPSFGCRTMDESEHDLLTALFSTMPI